MSDSLMLLASTAAAVGFFHTLLGPDHYLPFIALSRARGWSLARTAWITTLCGVGHVLSSIVLGMVGIALGLAVSHVETVEAARGELAAWLLIAIGLVYMAWGLHRALRAHAHRHPPDGPAPVTTPWMLFLVFVLGPCEPLIPIFLYPAATGSTAGTALVAAVFSLTTLATMLGVVLLGVLGVRRLPLGPLERFSHALAGATIFLCGVGIRFLGL